MQTRGKPALALMHAGGVVREIELEAVKRLLIDHDLPSDGEVAEAVWRTLCNRLVYIDASPTITRDDEAALARIESAAEKLTKALGEYSATGDLKLAIADDLFSTLGYMDDGANLNRWLARLAVVRKRYFRSYNPSAEYHEGICRLRDIIRGAGGNVAVHATSRFVRFLLAVEAAMPALIFPRETVGTDRARSRYVERALASSGSTN